MLGHFEIRGILGQGGSSTVYASVDAGREIALKVLREDLVLSERERRRFLNEARRMRSVEHPGLIALLGAGFLPDGRPYICMPRLSGETLASRLTRGALPIGAALAVFDVLAAAVTTLHSAGLIHRDIKPENIFLQAPGTDTAGRPGAAPAPLAVGTPVLLDFGIARDVHDAGSTTTQAGLMRGTPAYMAPERFFGTPASRKTDLYELATTLYMMLAGRLPWDDPQSAAARLSPMHPRSLGVDLPERLTFNILRALSTRPEARPDSVEALAEEIRRAWLGGPDVTRTTLAIPLSVSPTAAPVTREADGPRVGPRGSSGRLRVVVLALATLAAASAVAMVRDRQQGVLAAAAPAGDPTDTPRPSAAVDVSAAAAVSSAPAASSAPAVSSAPVASSAPAVSSAPAAGPLPVVEAFAQAVVRPPASVVRPPASVVRPRASVVPKPPTSVVPKPPASVVPKPPASTARAPAGERPAAAAPSAVVAEESRYYLDRK